MNKDKIELILEHELFVNNMKKCMDYEKERIYCKHDIYHSFDVARICYIIILENKMNYSRELVYALALLHDIGRARQYEFGEKHNEVGSELAAIIMHDVGFQVQEISLVKNVILEHSGEHILEPPSSLDKGFFQADFLARKCMWCNAKKTCKWMTKNIKNGI